MVDLASDLEMLISISHILYNQDLENASKQNSKQIN